MQTTTPIMQTQSSSLDTRIESPLLFTHPDGTQGFVHDTYMDFFVAKYFAQRITEGTTHIREFYEVFLFLLEKEQIEKSAFFRNYFWKGEFFLSENTFISKVAYAIQELCKDSEFILKLNKIALEKLKPFIGKEILLQYTYGDEMGWHITEYEHRHSIVLDGVIGKKNTFYFVGHNGLVDCVLAPCYKTIWDDPILPNGMYTGPYAIFGDGVNGEDGILESISVNWQDILSFSDIIFRVADYLINSPYDANSLVKIEEKRINANKNQFMDVDYLKEKGLIILLP